MLSGEIFADYIDWRAEHPSDDLMTELLNAEFEDETGTTRRLTRDEILTYVTVDCRRGQRDDDAPDRLGGQGAGRAPRPAARARRQTRRSSRTRSRSSSGSSRRHRTSARYVARDVEHYGQTVPEGSVMLFLVGCGEPRRPALPRRRPLRHPPRRSASTSRSASASTSASAPRSPASRAASRSKRCSKRFPEWDVDYDNAKLSPTSTVRGWETLARVHAMSEPVRRAPAVRQPGPAPAERRRRVNASSPPVPSSCTAFPSGTGGR